MTRPARLLLLAVALTATVAAAPAGSTATSADAGASLEEGTFPMGACAWARDVSDKKFCVTVNDPRPWLP